jgi:hypothetical protein
MFVFPRFVLSNLPHASNYIPALFWSITERSTRAYVYSRPFSVAKDVVSVTKKNIISPLIEPVDINLIR